MTKPLALSLTLFVLATIIIFAGCKKSSSSPKPTTITQPTQQDKIVYLDLLNGPNTYTLWTANYDGSGAQQVNIAMPANVKLGGGLPKISLDNKYIYFEGISTVSYVGSIYSCDMTGGNVKLLVAGGNGGSFGSADIMSAYYANQQEKILYAVYANYAETIWTANTDGSGQQQINVALPVNSYIPSLTQLAPSPDGKTIFFRLSLANSNSYIYSCGIDGSNLTPVAHNASDYSYYMGSVFTAGQQTKIVYINSKGSAQIMIANTDGSGATTVNYTLPQPASTSINPPMISPDGKTIFFSAYAVNGNGYAAYSCNTDGTNLKQILSPATRNDAFLIGQAF
jgi:Tol biopolymer transport system component